MPVGFVIGKIAAFVVQGILQFPREEDGIIRVIVLEHTEGDGRFFRMRIPVAFVRVIDMPEPVLAEPDAGPFFNDRIGAADIFCHHPDRPRLFRQDHPARKHFESNGLTKFFIDAPDHRAKSITPTAIRIVTIIDRHRSKKKLPGHQPRQK
ncbi:hypothetical protein [Puia sp.]|uniref:hypothetical protein n=1 Tax=Puia sp. TaxID=2045100 RepID=UPI0039C90FD2